MGFWSGQTLKNRAVVEQLIVPFEPNAVQCSAYELRVGNEAFLTRDRADRAAEAVFGRSPGHLVVASDESICIPSGQFAFLIAHEKIRIPSNAIGFISIKTGKKFSGLINVSGFHVDPGWSGRLIFAVFNAGPVDVVVQPEERLFLLFLADLDEEADEKFLYRGKSEFYRIPPELMTKMGAPVPTLYKLNETVRKLEESVKVAGERSLFSFALAALSLTIAATVAVRFFFAP